MGFNRFLFVLKLRSGYDCGYSYNSVLNSGLFNSARYIVDMLNEHGVEAKLVQVIDANSIDKEIHDYQPTNVICEAIWVPPAKFDELKSLYPNVKFTVRIHSEGPFLSQEGMATEWIQQYIVRQVDVAFNSAPTAETFKYIYPSAPIVYLPNYFPITRNENECRVVPVQDKDVLNIGCFGAIRNMKNQYNQALASIEYGRQLGIPIRFHINTSCHGGLDGPAILKNIRALFDMSGDELVEHDWMDVDDFEAGLVGLDIGLQVSFTESFNIIAAQMSNACIPIVVSPEIRWASSISKADPTSVKGIVDRMKIVTSRQSEFIQDDNLRGLKDFSRKAKHIWLEYGENEFHARRTYPD